MTTRSLARRRTLATPELDASIAAAESSAIVIWQGEQVRFDAVPERIARLDDRDARDRLYTAWQDGLEALNPLFQERLAAWRSAGDVTALAGGEGTDPAGLAVSLERFTMNVETVYYAALRRYLALIDIEQGDATEADLWHAIRGSTWAHWFGEREVRRAVLAAGRGVVDSATDLDGWRLAEHHLAGAEGDGSTVSGAIRAAYSTLAGSPEWLAEELGVASAEIAPFADFAAFVRLWRIRRQIAELQYELRLYSATDVGVQRAYYSGIVGHMTGVAVAEAGYLAGIDRPFASAHRLEAVLLGAMAAERLEQSHGLLWWREAGSTRLIERLGSASNTGDALAELGYDGLDWRPVLRQIRTRLIGEMSGYGGPNITTRAGTRKV